MAYYIQNPALQGFQEGNASNRAAMGIFGSMMENYLNNAAAAARQQAQRAQEAEIMRVYAAQGYTPSGKYLGIAPGMLIASQLQKQTLAPIEKQYSTQTPFRPPSERDLQAEGTPFYNFFPLGRY